MSLGPKIICAAMAAEHDAVRLMDFLGRLFGDGLNEAVTYLPAAEGMAALVFPPAVADLALVQAAVDLTQKAVVLVEQKFAAQGGQSGTGKLKLADVVTLTAPAVEALLADPDVSLALKRAGIVVSSTTVGTLASDIVGVLNAKSITYPKEYEYGIS